MRHSSYSVVVNPEKVLWIRSRVHQNFLLRVTNLSFRKQALCHLRLAKTLLDTVYSFSNSTNSKLGGGGVMLKKHRPSLLQYTTGIQTKLNVLQRVNPQTLEHSKDRRSLKTSNSQARNQFRV